jgi:hypothetical protein
MPLTVVSFCTYLTLTPEDGGEPWRSDDYNARDFVFAAKGRAINKYAQIPVLGVRQKLDNTNLGAAAEWFGKMAASYLIENSAALPLVLVPVPNSSTIFSSTEPPRTAQLAESIAKEMGANAEVMDGLRFIDRMPSANQSGGTRKPRELYKNLIFQFDPARPAPHILVDDVLTTGGHLRASAAELRRCQADVLMALCVGRADPEQVNDPFAIRTEDLEDFEP